MSLASFLSSLYLVFTIILLFKKKDIGNIYILFGAITFIFVIIYGYIPSIPEQIQPFGIFIVFSIMILLFGLMFGIGLKLFNRSDKSSVIASILSSSLLIAILFNIKGYLSYMYIPVLLYMIQNNVIIFIEKKRL
ncbi:hypothetical protein WS9_006630 [Paraclostridium sordellii 8483]|uniref:hypothetical protein n=1 Tax=Paraclostridium sordellii TaxID=1505 RepID=UPI0003129455|nr:hypothetical protein [Paeniclostridium sordellii]TAN68063.1 hypothetical protein WS9_006630 [Paeniclostridium sordellii 8483]